MNHSTIQTRDLIILGAILLLATVLRTIGLNSPLWHDELATVLTHLRLPWDQMMVGYEMNHHYLYSFQAKVTSELFGESAWSVRLPAMLFGVASVAALWWLVLRISGTGSAHATALLATLSYHHIWFSQNARGYTELMFWSILGLGLFLAGIRKPGMAIWAAFAATLALATFTHLTGLFFFATLGFVWVGWLLARAVSGRALTKAGILYPLAGFAGGLVLSAMSYLPILPGIFANAVEVDEGSAVDLMKEYQNPIWTFLETVSTIGAEGPLALIVLSLSLGLALIGAFHLRKREPLIGFIVFGHIFLTMALLVALGMRVWPRFFFVDIGLLLFLIYEGVRTACIWIGHRIPALQGNLLPLALAGMVAISSVLAFKNYSAPKQDIEGAIRFVEASRNSAEDVYVLGVSAHHAKDYYRADVIVLPMPDDFTVVESSDSPAWLIVPFPARTFRDFATLDRTVEASFDLVRNLPGTLGDGHVLVFHRKN